MKSDIVLTSMKSKVISVFNKSNSFRFRDIIRLSKLEYRQTEYVLSSLLAEKIIKRKCHGIYKLTPKGHTYQKLIDKLNLQDKENFRLKGKINEAKFLKSKNGAIITAALLSDGFVSHNRIKFLTNDWSLNKFVWKSLENIFNKAPNEMGILDGRINIEFLKLFSPTYKTQPTKSKIYPDSSIPDFIINGTNQQKYWFLRTYASCDGGVCFQIWWKESDKIFYIRSWVEIACKHPRIANELIYLFKTLGFKPHKIKTGLAIWTDDIVKFRKFIKFVDDCKAVHGKFWKGVRKNSLLDLASLITLLGSNIIPYKIRKENNKDKIIKYLRNIIKEMEKDGYKSVYHKLLGNVKESKEVKSITSKRFRILELLSIESMKYDKIARILYEKDELKEAKHKTSIILSRMKKKRLIINAEAEKWYITSFGKKLLKKTKNKSVSF